MRPNLFAETAQPPTSFESKRVCVCVRSAHLLCNMCLQCLFPTMTSVRHTGLSEKPLQQNQNALLLAFANSC